MIESMTILSKGDVSNPSTRVVIKWIGASKEDPETSGLL